MNKLEVYFSIMPKESGSRPFIAGQGAPRYVFGLHVFDVVGVAFGLFVCFCFSFLKPDFHFHTTGPGDQCVF